MRITHLFTGKDNQSHFEEIEVRLESRGSLGLFTDPAIVKAFFFREVPCRISVYLAHGCLPGVRGHS